MNDHKNHVGCLTKSIKQADQDIENIQFYSLGWTTEKQSTLAGLPTSRCMKKAPFTIIHEMNEHGNQVECLSESIKETSGPHIQIKTSKNLFFIVLADQLRNSRH